METGESHEYHATCPRCRAVVVLKVKYAPALLIPYLTERRCPHYVGWVDGFGKYDESAIDDETKKDCESVTFSTSPGQNKRGEEPDHALFRRRKGIMTEEINNFSAEVWARQPRVSLEFESKGEIREVGYGSVAGDADLGKFEIVGNSVKFADVPVGAVVFVEAMYTTVTKRGRERQWPQVRAYLVVGSGPRKKPKMATFSWAKYYVDGLTSLPPADREAGLKRLKEEYRRGRDADRHI